MSFNQFLQVTNVEQVGLAQPRWEQSLQLGNSYIDSNQLPALSWQYQVDGSATHVVHAGTTQLGGNTSPVDDTLYLVASVTKPIVAMAVLLLVERGLLSLNTRVVTVLPEFREASKRSITIRHLLTHTSGLPDMLPNNQELREQNAPLSEFVAQTVQAELIFSPGRGVQYQSMGYALLGPIIDRVAGQPYREFLRTEIFEPLKMQHSWLGLSAEQFATCQVAEVRVPEVQQGGEHWNWNSEYWQTLGAPWGGLLSTVHDLSLFCRCMLTEGETPTGQQLFHPSTVRMATENRLDDYPHVPEHDRRSRGWGFGWRMNWLDHRGAFSDMISPQAFGHWGATGTVFWIDPASNSAFVGLSTEPMNREVFPLVNLANSVVSARNS